MEKINYKKSLGQNFIYDTNLLRAIASDGDVCDKDLILEIGAGAGTLTKVLADRAEAIIAFEIDKDLKPRLEALQKEHTNIEFRFMDFMECDLKSLLNNRRAKVVANIPYYITTPIIFKLADSIQYFDSILVLVQKEVAERFAAKEGSKTYGITSVILQSIFDVSLPRIIKKECFTPSPKVDSALCKFVPHNRYEIVNFEAFKTFVHKSFAMRRKTFVNNIIKSYSLTRTEIIEILIRFNYNESIRPEDISMQNYINMFNELFRFKKL